MLKSLQEMIVNATVVRGESVLGHVDHIEIDDNGVYIVLEDGESPNGGEEVDADELSETDTKLRNQALQLIVNDLDRKIS